jgi:uncharacterized protein (TIGR03435 family)
MSVVVAVLCLATVLKADVQKFEFVSVRRTPPAPTTQPGAPAPRGEFRVLPDGRLEARSETVADLTRVAFGFEGNDPNGGVVKAAYWMWNDRFDVTASAGRPWTMPPPGTNVPTELRAMLRVFLEDRFALQARVETRKVDVVALRLAKPDTLGPYLHPSTPECLSAFADPALDEAARRARCPVKIAGWDIEAQAVTMSDVAQIITQWKYQGLRLVVDQTGLSGLYDVSVSLKRERADQERLLEDQLGMKLASTSASLPTLIIESAKKPRLD